ncbi:unnamed protein product, partial [Rotaria magnacalcarata]
MARKRSDNKKRKSRPSQKNKKNRNSKPSKVRKNNLKASSPSKPSRQRRKTLKHTTDDGNVLPSLETYSNEEILDATILHTFLSDRYLSEIQQPWYSCKCCSCEHPYSNMHSAK